MATSPSVHDRYNDFLSEGGKLWPLVRDVAGRVGLLENLRRVMAAARGARVQVVVVPHHRWMPGDYQSWDHPSPDQVASGKAQAFAAGTWGGTWHPDFVPGPDDIVAKEHWGQNGFAHTDLDLRLRQQGIARVVLAGLLANTCIESTGRAAMELGYHVTLVTDATAAFSDDRMHAAHALNGPGFAHALVTAAQFADSLSGA
jgi:nicotinamidase-related amidase